MNMKKIEEEEEDSGKQRKIVEISGRHFKSNHHIDLPYPLPDYRAIQLRN